MRIAICAYTAITLSLFAFLAAATVWGQGEYSPRWFLCKDVAKSSGIYTEHEAILAAREICYCLHPLLEQQTAGYWLSEFEAYSAHGVWFVSQRLPVGYAGGGPNFWLSEYDGRLLDIIVTQ